MEDKDPVQVLVTLHGGFTLSSASETRPFISSELCFRSSAAS